MQIEEMLSDSSKQSPSVIADKIKATVIKYSVTTDADLEHKPLQRGPKPLHKDLRQSIFIADKSLELLPRTAAFSKVREYLHYKRIRLLAQFNPTKIAAANAEFQKEFPHSDS